MSLKITKELKARVHELELELTKLKEFNKDLEGKYKCNMCDYVTTFSETDLGVVERQVLHGR